MFRNAVPRILAHIKSIEKGNFVTPEYIINNKNDTINVMRRFCPHRQYPMHNVGENVKNIFCNFHGFEWDENGYPLNNDRTLHCGTLDVGQSGLLFRNFEEPKHQWVDDLKNETELVYSHTVGGKSNGSWLWMMEIQADLLHIRRGENAIHPELAEVTNLDDVGMFDGDGWILQTCSTGWWLFVYPYTFVEWSPGCLSINYTIPNDYENEFGFEWITQFYFAPWVTEEKRKEFETLEDVFHEDVEAIEKQKGGYYPLMKSVDRLEEHCVHFGKWYNANKE